MHGGFLHRQPFAPSAQFAVPEPQSPELQKLILGLSGYRSSTLPRDKRAWLSLLVESPYLCGPLQVFSDEFSSIGYEIHRPRNQSAVPDARFAAGHPPGAQKHALVDDLIESKDLIPVSPKDPGGSLLKILGPNIPRWTGRDLLAMSMTHYASVGEAFWSLGTSDGSLNPDEALTLTPTQVIETPQPRDRGKPGVTGYRLEGTVGTVPEESIFEWSRPDPKDPIFGRGRGLIQALGDEAESVEDMSRLISVHMRNDNRPSAMFIYKSSGQADLSREAMERRFDRKNRGLNRRNRMMFEQVTDEPGPVRDGYAIEQLGETLDPKKVTEYSEWAWNFIRQYLRIPPSMLGNYDRNNRLGDSGIEVERVVFLMSVMTPLVLSFESALQDLARRVYDERLVVRHRPFVEVDREFRLKVAERFPDHIKAGEVRNLGGWGSTGSETADQSYIVRRGRVIVADLEPGNEVLENIAASGSRQDQEAENALP